MRPSVPHRKGSPSSPRTVPSWSGTGVVELTGKRERMTLVDGLVVFGLLVAIDVAGFVVAALLTAQSRLVCGYHCFPAPSADLHDARAHLWIGGVAAGISLLAAFLARRARVLTAVVQLGLLLALVVYTVPIIERAHAQQRHLEACQYGYRLPCHGVRDLGTPTGT